MINLGDKKWGVKDSGLLAYKQVGSKYFNKDFDFTRASSGTYIDKNGVLQTAEVYNLLDYSQDFTQWTILNTTITDNQNGYNGLNNASKVSFTSGSSRALGEGGLQTGIITFSVYLKAGTHDIIQFTPSNSATTFANFNISESNPSIGNTGGVITDTSITSVGNGWYRCTATLNNTGTGTMWVWIVGSLTSSRASAVLSDGDFFIQDAQLVEGTEARDYQYTNGRVGIPRVDFSDGVGALLLEPQRSNLLLQSNQFDTTWLTTNTSVTGGQDGIYGTNDAWQIERDGFGTGGYIYQDIVTSGANTISVYAKAGTLNWMRLRVGTAPKNSRYFDLQNGVIGTGGTTPIDAKIESVGNGWYHCSITTNIAIDRVYFYPVPNDGDISGTSGSIYIQHAQLEDGSYPTSIIETTTSQVTRIADVANNCGTEQDFNSEEGVLYAEASALADGGVNRHISITDGTYNNYVTLRYSADVGRFQAFLKSGGGVNNSLSSVANVQTDNNKIALVYKASEFSMWLNGSKVSTMTPTAMPIGLDELALDWVGANNFYGKVRSVKYFPTALTDEELENLTT